MIARSTFQVTLLVYKYSRTPTIIVVLVVIIETYFAGEEEAVEG